MGFSSQAGQVMVRTQTTADTFPADIGTAGIAVRLRSGGLAPSRELMIPDPEIGGGRDIPDAYLGGVSWSGDYEFYARMPMLSTFFRAALGTATSAAATGVNTHTFTPSDAAQLPFLGIEERIGSGLETYRYTDSVVNTLHLEADAGGYLQGTAGIIARKQTAGNTATAAAGKWDETPMLVGTNITLTYNSVTVGAKSFSLDINNNFEDDDYRLGSFFIGDLTPKRREVTAGFSIREENSAMWRQAVYGTPGATAPGGIATKNQLVINMATYEDIQGGTPATKHSLQITIPNFILTPYALEASGDDVIESDLEGQAVKPVTATPLMTAVVKSSNAAIA